MSSLVSINVGLPREVMWEGKPVRTAIWKQPVAGRVWARHLNVEGDGQGDLGAHGGEHRAVMVYQLDSYRYWETYLKRHDFEHGQFGENLTVDGLPDDKVCIGDRYHIGDALFEVTQPRVTCFRVGMRMNNPEMPSLLVAHKRPGFYLRVIEEGEIGAGDAIVKTADGPEGVTVAEVDALLYLPGRKPEELNRALRVPALSTGWKVSLEALVPPVFQTLRVAAIERESADVLSFTLEQEDRRALPAPIAGQFLLFKLQLDTAGTPLLRSYSISGPQDAGTYRVSVKRAKGPGSNYFHDRIHTGDLLQVSSPRGSFMRASENMDGNGCVVLLSAGIGATPLLAMLHSLAAAGSGKGTQKVWWCHGARDGSEHLFAAEVRDLLSAISGSRSWIAYSKPEEGDRQGVDYDTAGRLSLSSLQQMNVPQTADFYLCGPPAFLTTLTKESQAWCVPQARIHSESFGGAPLKTGDPSKKPHAPKGAPGTGPNVSFSKSGLSVPWDPQFKSLLELAEACDVPVQWSCRTGVCHTCESGLVKGGICYAPEPLDPPAAGNVLICCSVPAADIQLDL